MGKYTKEKEVGKAFPLRNREIVKAEQENKKAVDHNLTIGQTKNISPGLYTSNSSTTNGVASTLQVQGHPLLPLPSSPLSPFLKW